MSYDYAVSEAQERHEFLKNWPAAWGDAFQFVVSFDWVDVAKQIDCSQFGIVITTTPWPEYSPFPDGVIARASVAGKTQADVDDAVRRINDLLGLLSLLNYGSRSLRWYCHLTHLGITFGSDLSIRTQELNDCASALRDLSEQERRLVRRALYWLRVAPHRQRESHRTDLIRMFEMYWNAFECVTNAGLLRTPIPKKDRRTIKRELSTEFARLVNQGRLTREDVARIKQIVGGPGQVRKLTFAVSAALKAEDVHKAEIAKFVKQLCGFRNELKHADLDAEDNATLMRAENLIVPFRYLTLDLLLRALGRRGFGGWEWLRIRLAPDSVL